MRQRFCFITVVFIALTSIVFAQEEPVKGYYDPVNEWFVFEYTSPEKGPRKVIYDPPNKVDPVIEASVTWDNGTKGYIYNFKVSNGSKAKQLLDSIIIKFSATIYEQVAPNEDWDMGEYRTGRTDTWEWSKTIGEPAGIPPTGIQEGFSYKSKGLPSIIDMFFGGEKRVRFSGPSPTYDPHELHEAFSKVFEQLESQYPQTKETIKRKTIGPKDPPADLKATSFIDYIIAMKHEAFSLGWITNQGIEQSLDAKLENAKRKLEQGNTNAAKNVLEAFINEVEAQGCSSYENCSTGKHLTSEAYAFLKYNTQYLIDQLGGEKKKEDESKKE